MDKPHKQIFKNTTMKKLLEYLNSHGFWFSCTAEDDRLAQEAVNQGILQPIENLGVGYPNKHKSFFYVRAILKTKHEIPASMWRHFVEEIPC